MRGDAGRGALGGVGWGVGGVHSDVNSKSTRAKSIGICSVLMILRGWGTFHHTFFLLGS